MPYSPDIQWVPCHQVQSVWLNWDALLLVLRGSLQHGTCTLQPSKQAFSSNKLSLMIQDCGVNCLNQFAMFLAQHLCNSQQNLRLLALMQMLNDALYSGLALPQEEEEWACGNRIRLHVSFVSISDTIVLDFSTRTSLVVQNVAIIPSWCCSTHWGVCNLHVRYLLNKSAFPYYVLCVTACLM